MPTIRMHVFVEGRVQGVFFRAETKKTAQSFNLTGWVRNLADGRVEAVFEGEERDVERMVAWCRQGPPYAAVTQVQAAAEPATGACDDFSIAY